MLKYGWRQYRPSTIRAQLAYHGLSTHLVGIVTTAHQRQTQPIITSSNKTTTKVVGLHACCSCILQVGLITVMIQSVSVWCSSSGSISHSIKKLVSARPACQASLATRKSTRWFSKIAKKVICDPYLWTHDRQNLRSASLPYLVSPWPLPLTFDRKIKSIHLCL